MCVHMCQEVHVLAHEIHLLGPKSSAQQYIVNMQTYLCSDFLGSLLRSECSAHSEAGTCDVESQLSDQSASMHALLFQ